MMYRVMAIVGGAFALAACSSGSMNLDALSPAPAMDSIQFESDPPGAEARVSNGQTCRTPCALALPTSTPLTVTFSLTGYQPETESIEVLQTTGSPPTLRPNPVSVQLSVAAPPPKTLKKPAKKRPATTQNPAAPKTAAKPTTKKRAAKKPATAAPQPASAAPSTPAPVTADPQAQPQTTSPWPATTPTTTPAQR